MAQPVVATPTPAPNPLPFNALPNEFPVEDHQTDVIEPTEPTTEPTEPTAQESQAEAEASQHGWESKQAWIDAGKDPARWRPASEFLDIRRNIQSVLKDENRELRARLAAVELREKERERKTAEAQTKFTQEDLRLQLKQAAEDGDWAKHADLTDKLTDLKAQTLRQPVAPQTQLDPETQIAATQFRDANKWLQTDRQLARAFAVQLKAITEVDPQINAADALKDAKDMVMRMYPERFRNPNRTRPPMFETNGTDTGATNGRTWADLNPRYRAEAEMNIKANKYKQADFLAACADDPDAWRR